MEKITYPYGFITRLAEKAGLTRAFASNVVHGHAEYSLTTALALDSTGMIPERNFTADLLAAKRRNAREKKSLV